MMSFIDLLNLPVYMEQSKYNHILNSLRQDKVKNNNFSFRQSVHDLHSEIRLFFFLEE